MRISPSEDHLAFRASARSFVTEHWRSGGDAVAFRQAAMAAKMVYRSIPSAYGGGGLPLDPDCEQIWYEECRVAGAPGKPAGTGVQMLVPTLLEAGNEAQLQQYLNPVLTGAEIWAQGFSEPGAGSDLASLRTKAVLDGDFWIVDGQKIWTTHAERADFMFALVRTEPEAPKHKGISFLLIDMRSPGITVRPIRQMTNEYEYCEVFLDAVRVPAENIVGKRGDGWRIANLLLKHERGWIGDFISERFDRLIDLVNRCRIDGVPASACVDVMVQVAEIEGHVLAHHASSLRRQTATVRDEPAALIDYVAKLYATDVMERISSLVATLLQSDLLGPSDDPWGDGEETANGYWVRDWYWSMAYAIAGGSSNVQRDVIALRGLGLARPGLGK